MTKWNSCEQFDNKYDKHMSNSREQDIKFAKVFTKKAEHHGQDQHNILKPMKSV